MNHLDYIYTDNDNLIANSNQIFHYKGYLANISDKIFMRFGINNWDNVNEVEMEKVNGEFIANISLPGNADNISFSFKNENEYWDNNYEENYSFKILPSTLNVDIKEEIKTEFFKDDPMLAYNLNKEVNNHLKEFTVGENGEVLKVEKVKKEIENFEDELDIKLEEIKAILFNNTKDVTDILSSAFIEASSPVKEELTNNAIYFYSSIPYVKIFKEARAEEINSLIEEISLEAENLVSEKNEYVFTSKVSYARQLRNIARESFVQYELKNEENTFLVVSPYSQMELFDNSVFGTIKKIALVVKNTYKNISFFLSRSLGFSESL